VVSEKAVECALGRRSIEEGRIVSIGKTYAAQIRDETGKFGAWFPNAEVAVGDYGTVEGPVFEKLARLDDVQGTAAPAKATYDFNINADRAINADAKAVADAGATSGSALLEVKFHKEVAVSFSAPDGVITRVGDLLALGRRLIDLGEEWKQREHYVVIEVVTVPRATILISQNAGAEMKFEVGAKTPINPQVMANLDVASSLRVSKGVSTKIIGEGPLTPLFRLAHLKSRLFAYPEIKVYRGPGEVAPEQLEITQNHYLEIY
jgi:hypothetical protein